MTAHTTDLLAVHCSKWQFHNFLSIFINCLAVVVNFNEDSFTVAESNGQISVSLRINGKFFAPVWAIVEIIDGTATGGCAYAYIIGLISCAYTYTPS